MRLFVLPSTLFLCSALTQAAELKDFAGTWAVRLGSRNLFVLTLSPSGTNLAGIWERPTKYSSVNGAFCNFRDGVRRDPVREANIADGILHFTVQSAKDATDLNKFALTLNSQQATLAFDDMPPDVVAAPLKLERAAPDSKVATDWEPNRLYTTNDSDIPSVEMKAIFDEDQRVRMDPKIDWSKVGPSDRERREQTRKLLATGALHTGADYKEAAFVFQHGDKAEDYLLAHTLAMVAVSKGEPTAIWIAAATLDRYLAMIGQKQIFGTQFSGDAQRHWSQEPYDRDLVSDVLRQQLAVPTQALQIEQLKIYQKQQ